MRILLFHHPRVSIKIVRVSRHWWLRIVMEVSKVNTWSMVDAVKSSDNEACQKSTTYRKIVLYVLMAASKNFVAVKQPYEFFNGIGPNLFSSFSLPPPPAFLLRPPSFFLLPSPKRRRPAHFWFIWGLCLKRVKVSQRARSLNFLAEQLSTVLEIPRVLKRKTYAEFLSLKETDLLVVCLLWTKGDAMLNPSIAITSGFFGNVFFFFFFPFALLAFFSSVSCIRLEIIISWEIEFCARSSDSSIHGYKKVNNSNSFSSVFKMSASEIASGLPRLSVHLNLAMLLNHSCNSSKVDNSVSNFTRLFFGWNMDNKVKIQNSIFLLS